MTTINLESIKKEYNRNQHATTFSIDVILRLLSTLRENGHTKRTNLAGRTGLNYNKCIKYISLLGLLGWVKIVFDNALYVIITDKGIEIIEKLTNF